MLTPPTPTYLFGCLKERKKERKKKVRASRENRTRTYASHTKPTAYFLSSLEREVRVGLLGGREGGRKDGRKEGGRRGGYTHPNAIDATQTKQLSRRNEKRYPKGKKKEKARPPSQLSPHHTPHPYPHTHTTHTSQPRNVSSNLHRFRFRFNID